jgi:hypothetical protein
MTGTDDRLDQDEVFRAAGLVAVPGGAPSGTLPAVSPTAASARPEDGRVDKTVDHGTPGLVDAVNRYWFELATQYGLFDRGGQFLVACSFDGNPPRWQRVRLASEWDLAGAGAETGVFGSGAGHPELVALSLDSHVMVQITVYESFVCVIALPDPSAAESIRTYLLRAATLPVLAYTDMDLRTQAQEWLRHCSPELLPEHEN